MWHQLFQLQCKLHAIFFYIYTFTKCLNWSSCSHFLVSLLINICTIHICTVAIFIENKEECRFDHNFVRKGIKWMNLFFGKFYFPYIENLTNVYLLCVTYIKTIIITFHSGQPVDIAIHWPWYVVSRSVQLVSLIDRATWSLPMVNWWALLWYR